MATKVHMEALSPTMEEGEVVRWLKSEGDEVQNGDVLAEIETDKATMELAARGSGVLRKVLVQEGGVVPVGSVIAVIGEADEDISELVDSAGGAGETAAAADAEGEPAAGQAAGSDEAEGEDEPDETDADGAEEAAPEGGDEAEGEDESERDDDDAAEPRKSKSDKKVAETPGEGAGRVRASPLARRLAADAGLELASIEGSGPGGRIVKSDVERAQAAPAPAAPSRAEPPRPEPGREEPAAAGRAAPPAPEPWSDAGAEEGYDDLPVSQMRKTIARRLTESLSPVPHFFLTVDIDMARVLDARASLNAMVEPDGDKLSVNDFVLKATATALRRHPDCNAAWHTDHMRRYRHIHLGVAVAVEDGLITPIVKHADRKGLVQISREVKEMAGRARKKRLKPDEYTGATFSVSNLGMFGIHEFTAIINPPEAGILAVGAVEDTPVAVDGEVVVRPRMRITMSCDHRVIDGAQGSRFLQTLKAVLEEPAAALL